jgi:hypothetical protein
MHVGGGGVVQEACERIVEVVALDHAAVMHHRVLVIGTNGEQSASELSRDATVVPEGLASVGVHAGAGSPVGSAWMAIGIWILPPQ